MHAIERLRSVARARGAGPSLLVREAAEALVGLDPGAVVPDPASAGHTAPEPGAEALRSGEAIRVDPTPQVLGSVLPDDITVVVLGWPEQVSEALRRRGDLEVLVADCAGVGLSLARHLRNVGVEADLVPEAGLGAAVGEADLVLLEATAVGPDGFLAGAGSRAAAAVARSAGIPVWVTAGVGRVLPARLWEALLARLDQTPEEPWHCPEEAVSLALVDRVARPDGLLSAGQAPGHGDCSTVPELLRPIG
ncbi:MAG: hypothetical protein M3404_04335 [Actinomycetota bacterium]|nr:hypothetical protein [Actinomycetota bacterium]